MQLAVQNKTEKHVPSILGKFPKMISVKEKKVQKVGYSNSSVKLIFQSTHIFVVSTY